MKHSGVMFTGCLVVAFNVAATIPATALKTDDINKLGFGSFATVWLVRV